MELETLRWTLDGYDVTCDNCHTAIYEPDFDDVHCPTCRHALGEDLFSIHSHMADEASRRYEMSQTSGVNPSLYTNYKKKGAKKGKSK